MKISRTEAVMRKLSKAALMPKPEAVAGSAATCVFLAGLTGRETCGRPATHLRVPGNLRYCIEHAARLLPCCSMVKLPNVRVSESARENPSA
jgi:hypothetical protein